MLRALRHGVVALGLAAMAGPVLSAPTARGLGAPGGEGASHLWGLVTTTRGLWTHGPYRRVTDAAAVPDGVVLDLVDPAHLLLVAPGWWLGGLGGATVAWTLLHLLHLLLAAWGADRLTRQLGGDDAARLVAVAGTVGTPFLWGGVPLGRSELLGLLLVPVVLTLVHDLLHRARWPARAVAVGASVLLLAHHGWQALALSALVLVPGSLLLAPDLRSALPRLLAAVLPAALLTLPMLASHLALAPWWTERLGGLASLGEGRAGTELLAALRLGALRPPMDSYVPPYAGLVALAAASWGLVRGGAARRWSLLGLVLVLLSLGTRLQLGDGSLDVGPARLLALILPPLGGLTDWARLLLAAGPVLAVGAGLTLRARPRRAVAVAALLLVDGMTWRLDAPATFPTAPPDDLAAAFAALPDGPVLALPLSGPETRDDQVRADHALLWSLRHGHPVAEAPSPVAPPARAFSVLTRIHQGGMRGPQDCLESDGARLYARGFRSVLLRHGSPEAVGEAGEDGLRRRYLTRALGEPAGRTDAATWWALAPGDEGPARCVMKEGRPAGPGRGPAGGDRLPGQRPPGPG